MGVWRCVTSRVMSIAIARSTAAGDEAGTAPEDRPFRPDVQGLRAVAILLVVLYHAAIPGISGGYVGVDVFFVISGFVITGVLLRERVATRRTSIVAFYGRRARRIIPAASLVIIVTVVAAYHYLGALTGHETAVDGQWAALFLANFHFAASQTNYLASQQPPSALQNFWSLAVEEQFYIVYPTIFLVTARLARGISLRSRLTVVLVSVIVVSYAYSIVLTSTNAPSAFFSPLTRAWELALGGLIAVAGQSLRRVPAVLGRPFVLARTCRDRGGEPDVERDDGVSRRVGGAPRSRSRPRHRGGYRTASVGRRTPPTAKAISAPWTHLVLVVSVALADPHHCDPKPWDHDPARLGQRHVARRSDRGGGHHLLVP